MTKQPSWPVKKACLSLHKGPLYRSDLNQEQKQHKRSKSHHNVGGLPEEYAVIFKLIGTMNTLFKDEVRELEPN